MRADALPVVEGEGKRVRLIAGSLYGARAPVEVFSEMFYADAELSAGARLELSAEHEERAVYIAEGRIELGRRGASRPARLLVLRPGEPLAGRRRPLRAGCCCSAASRWTARGTCLVELRLQLGGAHRPGEGRLAGRAVSAGSRRDGIHSAAGGVACRQLSLVTGRIQMNQMPRLSPCGVAEWWWHWSGIGQ